MTPTLLREIGEALYGTTSWRVALAADLGVNRRTLQRWAAGHNPVPEHIQRSLYHVVAGRIGALHKLALILAAPCAED